MLLEPITNTQNLVHGCAPGKNFVENDEHPMPSVEFQKHMSGKDAWGFTPRTRAYNVPCLAKGTERKHHGTALRREFPSTDSIGPEGERSNSQ